MALEDEPDFVGVMNNVTVVRGRDAIFSCSVSPWDDEEFTVNYFLQIKLTFDPIIFEFKKQFQIGWVKVDDLSKSKAVQAVGRNAVTQNPRISVDNSPGSTIWNLVIKNVQPQDAGKYMVQINTEPHKSQVVHSLTLIAKSVSITRRLCVCNNSRRIYR